MSSCILGIDISKVKFDVALFSNDKFKTKKFSNNKEGFKELVEWLNRKKASQLHACMEATGNYGEALATYLFDNNYLVSVVNPAQIKGFSRSELSRTKTDKTDAKLIARFCKAIQPKRWEPKPQHIRDLQALVRRLKALQDMFYQENNRLYVTSLCVKSSIEDISARLAEEMALIKSKIFEHIEQNPNLCGKKRLLYAFT